MTFEDVNNYSVRGYYLTPNEDTPEWRKIVKGLRVDRAAAICSSGEVGLIAMLPTVRKELVLVDHSYASLSIAMLKYLMLRELGAAKTKRLLTAAGTPEELRKSVDKLVKKLPVQVRQAYERQVKLPGYEGDFVTPARGVPAKNNTKLKREWDTLPQRDIRACVTKLDRVKFLHGDLTDLAEHGPFDLVYLSNALEHRGRKGEVSVSQVAACIRPGGYVIVAHRGTPHQKADRYDPYPTTCSKLNKAGLEVVCTARTKAGMAWSQTLYRLPIKQEVAA
jgi:SAM-dependent methyltransferase